MNNRLIFCFLQIFISSLSFSQEKKIYAGDYIVKVGDNAPDFTINEADGKSCKLSDILKINSL